MRRFVAGRGSGAEHTVFTECLERRDREEQSGSGDRYIFVDELDLAELGFSGVHSEAARPLNILA